MNICVSVRPDLTESSQNYQEFWLFPAKLLEPLLDLTTYKIHKINSIPAASDENREANKTNKQSWINLCLCHALVIDIHALFQFAASWGHTAHVFSGKHSICASGGCAELCCSPPIWQLRAFIYHHKQPRTCFSLPLSSCTPCKFSLAEHQILLSRGHP